MFEIARNRATVPGRRMALLNCATYLARSAVDTPVHDRFAHAEVRLRQRLRVQPASALYVRRSTVLRHRFTRLCHAAGPILRRRPVSSAARSRDPLQRWIDSVDAHVAEAPLITALHLDLPREVDGHLGPCEGNAVDPQ